MKRAATTMTLTAVLLAAAAPAAHAAERRLFVYGDSLAMFAAPFMPGALQGWKLEQDVFPSRRAAHAAKALARPAARRSAVVHLSLGTVDDPKKPEAFRAAVRRAMQAAGPRRCVVWANVWRPGRDAKDPGWGPINRALDEEAATRQNLLVVDWAGLVARNPQWLDPRDGTHVDDRGSRARARAVATQVKECRRRLVA